MARNFDNKHLAIAGLVLLVIALVGCNHGASHPSDQGQRQDQAAKKELNDQTVQTLVSSEELLLELTPRLRELSKSVMNLQLPGSSSANHLFAKEIEVSGTWTPTGNSPDPKDQTHTHDWKISDLATTVARENLDFWPALFDATEYFEHAKFYFVKGRLHEHSKDQFKSVLGFNGLASYKNGRKASLQAKLEVNWVLVTASADWQMTSWKLVDIETTETSQMLFRNVLSEVLDDKALFNRATNSRHTQLTSKLMSGGEYFFPPGEIYPFFFPDVTLEHPGIAVVDIDNDGFDDLYVTMQHEPNLLFRNKGDGSFEEVAAKYGLNIAPDSTCAIFADFDNDGDPDLFLGRARRNSLYFVNQGGKFVHKTRHLIDFPLPALVSSISAVDYNNDGLLDIYLSTYSPIEETNRFQTTNKPKWVDLFLSPQQAKEVTKRNGSSHQFIDRAGPPNLLLQNIGDGKFKVAKENSQLQLWRMSFQSSWNDFDGDGDQDVYVSNDYAPDNFFRNDGDQGFKDITRESGLTGMGFGMGVSWGDYDNDGQIDIYVTNMFSKAGQRITDQVAGIDPRLREMAQGNFLYRLDNGQFKLVSGLEKPALQVAKSGWSWGGQFLDFDNDGFRDIYATSGYYTAPSDIAVDMDL